MTEETSPIVKAILADKKLMNRLAWKLAWQVTLQLLPWVLGLSLAFIAGFHFAMRLMLKP